MSNETKETLYILGLAAFIVFAIVIGASVAAWRSENSYRYCLNHRLNINEVCGK